MAPRLRQDETTSANVVKLRPRKAKGAGGAKRSGKPPNRMKPPEHAARPAPKDRQPTEAEIRATTQERLVGLHHRHQQVLSKETAAKEVVAELRTQRQEVRAAIQNSCVPLTIYDEVGKVLALKTKRSDREMYEKQRALAFEAFGLPCGPAPELDLTGQMPEPAMAATYWRETGYRVAVDGMGAFADPQRDGVPPENVQDYMAGHADGTAKLGAGLKRLETEPAKADPAPPPLMVGQKPESEGDSGLGATAGTAQPDWSGFDNDPDFWSDEQREVFTNWFESLSTEDDVDIEHPGVSKAFDDAVAAETQG